MPCPKCGGLCGLEQHNDLGSGTHVYRCLICGWARTFIEKKQLRPIVESRQERLNHYNRARVRQHK